ncbi:DICT sensory domain-containing protein [Haloferacaceae archaeon DSL9]
MSFAEIIDAVPRRSRSIVAYNYRGPKRRVEEIAAFFGVPRANIERREEPESNAVLVVRENGNDIFSAPVTDLWTATRTTAEVLATSPPDRPSPTDFLAQLATATFASQQKRHLLVASRHIERRAYASSRGRLYACFQRLSRLQADLQTLVYYNLIASTGVDVHVLGTPDATVDYDDHLAVHGLESEELDSTWLVVYDGDGCDERKAGLLAQTEAATENRYRGFWSFESDRVDSIESHLTETYLNRS